MAKYRQTDREEKVKGHTHKSMTELLLLYSYYKFHFKVHTLVPKLSSFDSLL